MNPAANVGYNMGETMAGAALPNQHAIYGAASSGVWTSGGGMMMEPRMFTQAAMPIPTQETYSNIMMSGMPPAAPIMKDNLMDSGVPPHMLGMMGPTGYPPVNNILLKMDIPVSNFSKAINFSKTGDVNHNGLEENLNESQLTQESLEDDLLEQNQSREQAQLMEQFKQLRQWQQQQQQMLLQQQQAQLMKLQEEQHLIQQIISQQRQAQWGNTPPQPGPVLEGFSSPKISTSKPSSTIPQALAHGALSLAHMNHMLVGQNNPVKPQDGWAMTAKPADSEHMVPNVYNLDSAYQQPVYSKPGPSGAAQPPHYATDEEELHDAEHLYYNRLAHNQVLDFREGQHVEEPASDEEADAGQVDTAEASEDEDGDEDEEEVYCSEDEVDSTQEDLDENLPVEEKPLVSKHKTFEELLEEELRKEQEVVQTGGNKNSGKTKRKLPFLKKGQGIARFGTKMGHSQSNKAGTKSQPVSSTPLKQNRLTAAKWEQPATSKPQMTKSNTNQGSSSASSSTCQKQSTSTKPVLQAKPIASKPPSQGAHQVPPKAKPDSTSDSELNDNVNQTPIVPKSTNFSPVPRNKKASSAPKPRVTAAMSQCSNSSFTRRKKVEQDEQDEFEILEQLADDNVSFLSNASAVNRVLVQRKQERVVKPLCLTNKNASNVNPQNGLPPAKPIDTDDDDDGDDDDDEDIRSEELSNSEDDADASSSNEGDDTLRGETAMPLRDIPRKLASLSPRNTTPEDGATNPLAHLDKVHFSGSENDAKDVNDSLNDSEDEQTSQAVSSIQLHSKKDEHEPPSKASTPVDYGDDEEWDDPDTPVKANSSMVKKSALSKTKVSPSRLNDSDERAVASPPPTSQLVSKLFPSIRQEQAKIQQKKQDQVAAQLEAAKQAGSQNDGVQSKLLRDKLAELEREIERFRSENTTLSKLRKEREDGLQELKKEMAEFEKQKNDELKRLQEFKNDEMKKLKREKKQFEEYKKAMKTMPDKKERDEIESLKNQLAEAQEEIRRKETRWTSSSTRLRDRIEQLETENQELREEVRLLEKRRLEHWQQAPSNKALGGKASSKMPQMSPKPESKPAKYNVTDNALRLSNNMEQDSQDETMSDISDSSHLTTPSEAAAVRAAMPPAALSFHPASAASHVQPTTMRGASIHTQPTAMRGSAPKPVAMPDASNFSPGLRRSSEGQHASAAASSIGSADGDNSVKMKQRKRAIPINISNTIDKGNEEYEEVTHPDGKVEKLYSNGAREILFANGTRKQVSSDGLSIIVSFFNGDIKQILGDQRVVYYYAEAQTTHTTYPDGLEILQFPNGQTEKHYPDGTKEITFPDQTMKYLFPTGSEESIFPDGTVIRLEQNGNKVMEFPNGQREIHTQQYKRREYPDGTVKTVYPDGRQETRYSSGRLRVKDKNGSIIVDKRI